MTKSPPLRARPTYTGMSGSRRWSLTPGACTDGWQIVFTGPSADVARGAASRTGKAMAARHGIGGQIR